MHALCRMSGVPWATLEYIMSGKSRTIQTRTADKLRLPLRDAVEHQAEAARLATRAVKAATGLIADEPTDSREWPTQPLRAVLQRKFGGVTVLGEADRRCVYRRETLDTAKADRLCLGLGLLPEDVWPDWFTAYLEDAG